jgi:hypothetical protein
LSSGKRKEKVDDLINLSNDEENEEMWEEAKAVGLGADMLEEHDEEEEEEVAEIGRDAIFLEGFQLGGATAGEEHSAELARARFQCIPWK